MRLGRLGANFGNGYVLAKRINEIKDLRCLAHRSSMVQHQNAGPPPFLGID